MNKDRTENKRLIIFVSHSLMLWVCVGAGAVGACMRVRACMRGWVRVYVRLCACVYACMCACVCVCIYVFLVLRKLLVPCR